MGGFDDSSVVGQAVLELAADATFTFDEHGIVTSCSPAFESQFGYAPGAAVGKPITALLPALHHPSPQGTGILESHIHGRRRDGSRFPVRVRLKRVVSPQRHLIVGVAWPMGLADEKLLETEGMLRAVADSTTAVIYIKDTEGRYIWVNRRFEDRFRVSSEELRGKTDYDLLPKETADALRENDRAVAAQRSPIEYDETVPTSGEPRQYISIKFPLLRPSGEMYAICGISTDITERRQAEQRLRDTYTQLQALVADRTSDLSEAHQRLRLESARREELLRELSNLIATAHEGIWTLDADGRTVFVNARMAEMLGYTIDEMLGRSLYDFMGPEQRREAERYLARRMKGVEEQHDFELRRKDGSPVWTIISASVLRDAAGGIIGALGMLTDITDRKRAEEQQKLLLQELDHRVKNNLAMVQGLADLTMQKATSLDEFRETFGTRIQALARTHEALARARWGDVDIGELVALVLAAHVGASPGAIVTLGDSVRIPAHAATPLALVLNELGANALKHGALSGHGGDIRIEWTSVGQDLLGIRWSELHRNRHSQPRREGTGSMLMRGLVEYELGGTLEFTHHEDRFECRIVIPIARRSAAAAGPANAGAPA